MNHPNTPQAHPPRRGRLRRLGAIATVTAALAVAAPAVAADDTNDAPDTEAAYVFHRPGKDFGATLRGATWS